MKNSSLNVYLLFVISWFLHLGERVPVLGEMRIDALLVAILMVLAFLQRSKAGSQPATTNLVLRLLVIYALLTTPFVEWPGSVIRYGLEGFVKAVVFYYFTVAFVRTEADLRKFVTVFLACQIFRILEPLYLNVTEGYWGSKASMAGWEYLLRLSGAPSDVVNPNGLAFIVCTVLPFLYFMARLSRWSRLAFICLTPACLYVLALTSSRTGFLALLVIFFSILVKSQKRGILLVGGTLVAVIGFSYLSADQQDRYLSVFGKGDKNKGTVELRSDFLDDGLRVALRRPLFGHGLGTSREANANFGFRDQPAHNLYIEVAQELGFIGLIIFLVFLKSIIVGFSDCKRALVRANVSGVLPAFVDAMQVWLFMNILFSFASFGLSSYEWYLLGGFSLVVKRLVEKRLDEEVPNVGVNTKHSAV